MPTKVPKLNMHQLPILKKSSAVRCYSNKPIMMKLDLKTGLQKKEVPSWFENEEQSTKGGECKGALSF